LKGGKLEEDGQEGVCRGRKRRRGDSKGRFNGGRGELMRKKKGKKRKKEGRQKE